MSAAPSIRDDASTSALPEALKDLVRRVVRKARLWPSEQRELKAELESHFREGLIELTKDGVSLEQSIGILCEDFGDPDLAARLIHRSKKRGRPMIWKIITSTALVLLVIAAAGGGYLAYVSLGSPTPTVDYIAKINEPTQRTPEGDRAWPILREALLQFRPLPKELEATPKSLPRPGDEKWPVALAWVEANRVILPRLEEAGTKPTWGFLYDHEQTIEFMRQRALRGGEPFEEPSETVDPLVPPTLSVLLPNLSEERNVARFLILDARDRMTRGEFAEAWRSLDIAHRLGALLLSGQTIIEQLVGTAMISMSTNEARQMLHGTADALTPEQLALVKASHLLTMPICTLKGDFRSELFFFNDVVQYTFTDDGSGNGRLIPSQFAKVSAYGNSSPGTDETGFMNDAALVAMSAIHADRRETVAKYHEIFDKMEELYSLPLYDPRRAGADRVLDGVKSDGPTGQRFALINTMLPILSRANQLIREATMNELATRTLVAILRYRLERGALPQRLAELSPDYLAAVPVDEYSGMHLKYAVDGGRFTLYSVGNNLEDDGGSSEKVKNGAYFGREGPADIVYWPPAD
ncbi:MAG TPA: hypothetical protein VJZ71_03365 [Phycisphaerae bacterium]|nr:hypothetical protein [Phycisphaerae bacterium]